jgi:hypothetical protein
VKHVLGYLQTTKDYGLVLESPRAIDQTTIHAYADASFANDTINRKSTTGYVIMLDESPIFYRTKGQTIVTLSTTEAEYVAATSCVQDIVYYKQLLHELGYKNVKVILEQDNNGSIAHLKDPMARGRTRHLDIKMKWCTQYITRESIEVRYCPTADMIADVFTKALSGDSFVKHRSKMVNAIKGSVESNCIKGSSSVDFSA